MAVFALLLAGCGKSDKADNVNNGNGGNGGNSNNNDNNEATYDEAAERASFPPRTAYKAFLGNTHAHSLYSADAANAKTNGTPADHYALAKANGFDFYAVTDHVSVNDPGRTEYVIRDYTKMATDATTATFVGILGMEYTNNEENKVADGWGHINVYDSNGWFFLFDDWNHWNDWTNNGVNRPPHTIKELYDWMCQPDNANCVASFNHPSKTQFNSFAVYNPGALDHITMFEVYNTNTSYYAYYKTALAKGWKLAPITGMDNHALAPITTTQYRTGVMASSLTFNDIMDAMRNRRAYASMYRDLRILCYGNNEPMGSVLGNPPVLYIDIDINDGQADDPGHNITKIEVIGSADKDNIIATKTFDVPSHNTSCSFRIANIDQKYYFLKIYSQGMGADPCAYTAPLWSGK